MNALTESYVEHLRNSGLERIRRRAHNAQPKPVPKSLGPKRTENAAAAPPVRRTGRSPLDPVEVTELEQRLEHNRQVVEGRLFEIAPPLDLGCDESGLARERVRQVAKRAAKTMSDLAVADPRFSLMAEYRQAMLAAH